MTLPAEVQALVDQLRAALGVPACQITIDVDDAGTVQSVRPMMVFRRKADHPLTNTQRMRTLDKPSHARVSA